jgi:hypothetical protein
VLISGAAPKAPAPRLPTLIVEGKHDSMMPARTMRAFAHRAGPLATYVELDSGHFAFLDRFEACERAIASWLLEREREARRLGQAHTAAAAQPYPPRGEDSALHGASRVAQFVQAKPWLSSPAP